MAKKRRIESMTQEERNELGRAMAEGMAKTKRDSWNSAIAAVVDAINSNAKSTELIVAGDVVQLANGLRIEDEDEDP